VIRAQLGAEADGKNRSGSEGAFTALAMVNYVRSPHLSPILKHELNLASSSLPRSMPVVVAWTFELHHVLGHLISWR
jgi:hypothetical protein